MLRARVLFRVLPLATGLTLVAWFLSMESDDLRRAMWRRDRWILPGELISAHQKEAGSDCKVCHADVTGAVDEALCLECHQEIRRRWRSGLGLHGKLEGSCASCHSDHHGAAFDPIDLDPDLFNHERALFALTGAHRETACEACHGAYGPSAEGESLRRFVEIAHTRCEDCHEDPHRGEAGPRCDRCHVSEGWKGEYQRFRHQNVMSAELRGGSTFVLTGKHTELDCAECHLATYPDGHAPTSYRFADVGRACSDCHRDPHEGQVRTDRCDACHSAAGWHDVSGMFDHALNARFDPAPLHAGISCEECHESPRYLDAEESCAGCHAEIATMMQGDVHQGLVSCEKCHDPSLHAPSPQVYRDRCVECHNAHYGRMFFARIDLLSGEIRDLRGRGRIGPEETAWLESAIHHNFEEARRRLEEIKR